MPIAGVDGIDLCYEVYGHDFNAREGEGLRLPAASAS
jgi:hypothetical protein